MAAMALISSIPSPVQHIRGAGRGSVHAAAPDTTTWQITHFLCSPLVFALAKKTTAQTAKITNATVSAPTPVEPTSSIVLHAVGTPSPARAPRQC